MAFVQTHFTSVHLVVMIFCFFYSCFAIREDAQVSLVLERRQEWAIFIVYLVIAVVLGFVVDIVLFHAVMLSGTEYSS